MHRKYLFGILFGYEKQKGDKVIKTTLFNLLKKVKTPWNTKYYVAGIRVFKRSKNSFILLAKDFNSSLSQVKEQLENRLTAIWSTQEQLAGGLNLVTDKIQSISSSLTAMEAKSKEDVTVLQSEINNLQKTQTSFSAELGSTGKDLSESIDKLDEKIETAKVSLSAMKSEHKENVAVLQDEINDLQKTQASFNAKLDSTGKELSESIDKLDEKIETAKVSLSAMEAEHKENVAFLQGEINKLDAGQSSFVQMLGSAKQQMTEWSNDLNGKIENVNTFLSDIRIENRNNYALLASNQKEVQDILSEKTVKLEKFADFRQKLSFKKGKDKFSKSGFYEAEPWGTWMKEYACVSMRFLSDRDVNVSLVAGSYQGKTAIQLKIYANNLLVSEVSGVAEQINFVIPKSCFMSNGRVILSFVSSGSEQPGGDPRNLAYGLVSLSADCDFVMSDIPLMHNTLLPEWEIWANDRYALDKLVEGLDEESCALARLFLHRKFAPFEFTDEEIGKLKIAQSIDLSKYKIKNKTGFQPEVFWSKNGLKFIDDAIVKRNLKGRCVIDGGACSGDSAIMFSEYKDVDKIYSFEPMKQVYADMAETLKLNNCDRAEAINAALSDKNGFTDICGEKCKTVTVDEFCKDKKIGCIKFDLEGMETKALQGCLETIKRDKPILLICLYHTPTDFFGIRPMLEALNLGYKFVLRDTEPCNQYAGVHLMLIGYAE